MLVYKFFSTILITLLISSASWAKQFEINTQHSFVNFEVNYMKVSLVKGSFDDFQGSFKVSDDGRKVTSLNFVIATKSINTRDLKRDKHLRQDDFFNVKKYPVITFTGEEWIYSNGVLSQVIGSLELSGIKKSVAFSIDWKGYMNDPFDKTKRSLFLRAKTTINRQNFGLNWNKSLDSGGWIVDDRVRIDIIVEANPTDSRPAFSRFLIKNKEIKGDVLKEVELEKVSENKIGKESESVPHKKEGISKKISANDSRGLKSYVLLFVGFILFLGLLIGSAFLKKGMLSFLEKHLSERAAELISDAVLYSVLLAAAIVLAPYMGYGDYFAK